MLLSMGLVNFATAARFGLSPGRNGFQLAPMAALQVTSPSGSATSSPFGQFSVDADPAVVGIGAPIFVVGDAGTTTLLQINWAGVVGIGTATDNGAESLSGFGLAVGTSTLFGGSKFTIGAATTVDIQATATTTFDGGLTVQSTGGLSSAAGLVLSAGDLLLSTGKIQLQGTATSTNAGTEAITNTTGTSTISGNLDLTGQLSLHAGFHLNAASTTVGAGTTTPIVDCSLGNTAFVVIDRDVALDFKNCFGGDQLVLVISDPPHEAGADHQIDWDGLIDAWPNGKVASTTFKFPQKATTTIGYISQGMDNLFDVTFASSSDNTATYGILSLRDPGYSYQP